jgi:hypothetical protein
MLGLGRPLGHVNPLRKVAKPAPVSLASRRQPHQSGGAMEEPQTQTCFQFGYLRTDRRPRQPKVLRGSRETFVPCHREEGQHAMQGINALHSYTYPDNVAQCSRLIGRILATYTSVTFTQS